MKLRFAAALLLVSGSAHAGTPEDAVRAFYAPFLHATPTRQSYVARVQDLLAPKLRKALEAQVAYESACAKLSPPDEKPYMLDQNPFFLAPDGAKELLFAKGKARGSTARVVARLKYDETFVWEDTVVLRNEGGKWLVVDILWDDGSSLTKRLIDFASEQCLPGGKLAPRKP